MSKNKTRTKDKYRVVYNDNQRIELENEFRLNEYIAIPRKQEIAQRLQLSERQIKIWFQNRRAKKRKQQKRRQTSSNKPIVTPASSQSTPSVTNQTSLQPSLSTSSLSPITNQQTDHNGSSTPVTGGHQAQQLDGYATSHFHHSSGYQHSNYQHSQRSLHGSLPAGYHDAARLKGSTSPPPLQTPTRPTPGGPTYLAAAAASQQHSHERLVYTTNQSQQFQQPTSSTEMSSSTTALDGSQLAQTAPISARSQQHQFAAANAATFVNTHHNQDQAPQLTAPEDHNEYQPSETIVSTSAADQLQHQHLHQHQQHQHQHQHQQHQHQHQQHQHQHQQHHQHSQQHYHQHHHQYQQYHHHHPHQQHAHYNGLSTAMQQHSHQLIMEQHYASVMATGNDQQSRLTASPSEQSFLGSIGEFKDPLENSPISLQNPPNMLYHHNLGSPYYHNPHETSVTSVLHRGGNLIGKHALYH